MKYMKFISLPPSGRFFLSNCQTAKAWFDNLCNNKSYIEDYTYLLPD